jgi:magnesium and cobalt transporter
MKIEENLDIILKTGHSRYPLGDPDLDHVKGLIHSRLLLKQLLRGQPPDLDSITLKCPVVPDTQRLSKLVLDLQETQIHCARVEDEHGTTIGFIFLEDAIEEIVGPLRDEFDDKEPELPQSEGGMLDLPGSTPIPEASRILGVELDDETDTIGGLVVATLGRVPKKGESIEVGPYLATVATIRRRRVGQLHFEIKKAT